MFLTLIWELRTPPCDIPELYIVPLEFKGAKLPLYKVQFSTFSRDATGIYLVSTAIISTRCVLLSDFF